MNYKERNREIAVHRMQDGWSAEAIGRKYGLSRSRVFQILQSLGYHRTVSVIEHRRARVFEFICSYKVAHDGVAPSLEEVADNFGALTTGGAGHYVRHLIADGKLTKPGASYRTVEVVGGTWIPPLD